jgi:DNA invertase Pin-like site-specific DNA recombinase
MIAAIYARKSTDQNVSDEEKSIARQVEHARGYAQRKGWTVDEGRVYADDGISGAEFLKRPGLTALLAAIRVRPCPVQVLIVMEVSRLGREQTETAVIVRELLRAGIRVFTYGDGRELTLDSALDKFQLNALNFVAEMERELARTRTRDALRRKAGHGHVAGGKVYGYSNRDVIGAGGGRDHVERDIVPAEAAVIRRIFREIAEGRGFSRIAKGLNEEAVPCPAHGRGWATSGVRELVLRDLYRGRIVWGRTRWVDRGGTKVKQDVPASEWLVLERPELRIVDPALWEAAHARLDRTRAEYKRLTDGRLVGRAASATRMPYLLSTLLECGRCRGPMHATRRTGRRARPRHYYVCTTHRVRGDRLCTNGMSAPMERLDTALLAGLGREILTPDLVDDVVQRAVELRQAVRRGRATAEQLQAERRRLDGELRRYAEAIAASGPLPSLLEAIETRERRRTEVDAQIRQRSHRAAPEGHPDELRAVLLARLADWQALLERHPERARETILRPLSAGRVILTPRTTDDGRFYDFEWKLSFGALVAGLIGTGDERAMTVVPPEGSEAPYTVPVTCLVSAA